MSTNGSSHTHRKPLLTSKDDPDSDEDPKIKFENRRVLHRELVRTRPNRHKMRRELTGHVVTRWYRAPELILLQKDYGP